MSEFLYNFDGIPNGATLTGALTGYTEVLGAASMTASTTNAADGTGCARLEFTANGQAAQFRRVLAAPTTRLSKVFKRRRDTALQATPQILRFYVGATNMVTLRPVPDGRMTILVNGTVAWTSTGTLPTGVNVRHSLWADVTAGQIAYAAYIDNATTPITGLSLPATAAALGSSPFTEYQVGRPGAASDIGVEWIDSGRERTDANAATLDTAPWSTSANTAPTVAIDAAKTSEPWRPVTHTATVTDTQGGPFTYAWTVSSVTPTGALTSAQLVGAATPTVTYEMPPTLNGATVTLRCTVTDPGGLTGTATVTDTGLFVSKRFIDTTGVQRPLRRWFVKAEHQLVAAFALATLRPLAVDVDAAPSTVNDGVIVGYAWDFGDGTTDTDISATHTYAAAGTYTVTLTVVDDTGATATASRSVTVTTEPTGPVDPIAPPNLRSTDAGVDYLDIAWDSAGGPDQVLKYRVRIAPEGSTPQYYRDTTSLAMRISGRTPGTRYTVSVVTYAVSGSVSDQSLLTLATLAKNPVDPSGLVFDFDATNLTTTPVKAFPSDATLPLTLTAPDDPHAPSWAVTNSNPTLTFDGGDALITDVTTTPIGRNIPGHTWHHLVDIPTGAAGSRQIMFLSFNNTAMTGRITTSIQDGKARITGRRLAADVNQVVQSTTDLRGRGPTVVTAQIDHVNAVARIYLDKTLDLEVPFQTAGNSEDVESGVLVMGANPGYATPYIGSLNRNVGYQAVRTVAQIATTVDDIKANIVTPPPPPPPPPAGGIGLTAVEHESWWWKVRLNWNETDPTAEYQVSMDDRPGLEVITKGNTYATPHLEAGSHTWKVRKRLTTTPTVTTNPDGTQTTTYAYTYGPWYSVTRTVRAWPTPVGNQLKWPLPKDWSTAPKVINVSATATSVKIEAPGDYIVNFPNTPINIAAGDRRFEIYAALPATAPAGAKIRYTVPKGEIHAQPENPIGLKITGHGSREVWADIQGLLISGEHEGDGFHVDMRAPESTLVRQNTRVERLHGRQQGGDHSDVQQLIAGPKNLLVDCEKGESDYQGYFMDPKKFDSLVEAQPGLFGSFSFTNIEIIMHGQDLLSTGGGNLGKTGIPLYSIHDWETHSPKFVYPAGDRGIYVRAATGASAPTNGIPRCISNGAPLSGGDQKPGVWLNVQVGVTPPGGTVLTATPGLNYVSPGRAAIPPA